MKRELQELDSVPIPACMITIVHSNVGQSSVNLWVENMYGAELSFDCVQTITPTTTISSNQASQRILNKAIFDADFVYLPSG